MLALPCANHHCCPLICPLCAVEVDRAITGDIVSIAGVAAAGIADTVAAPEVEAALPPGARARACCCRGCYVLAAVAVWP